MNMKSIKIQGVSNLELVQPHTPLLTITGELAKVQLIETTLLNLLNYSTLMSTQALESRIRFPEKEFIEVGSVNAQTELAGLLGIKYSVGLGLLDSTSNLKASKLFNLRLFREGIKEFDPFNSKETQELKEISNEEVIKSMKSIQDLIKEKKFSNEGVIISLLEVLFTNKDNDLKDDLFNNVDNKSIINIFNELEKVLITESNYIYKLDKDNFDILASAESDKPVKNKDTNSLNLKALTGSETSKLNNVKEIEFTLISLILYIIRKNKGNYNKDKYNSYLKVESMNFPFNKDLLYSIKIKKNQINKYLLSLLRFINKNSSNITFIEINSSIKSLDQQLQAIMDICNEVYYTGIDFHNSFLDQEFVAIDNNKVPCAKSFFHDEFINKLNGKIADYSSFNCIFFNSNFIVSEKQPALGMVYKLAEIDNNATIKLSEEKGKSTIPGKKYIIRLFDEEEKILGDVLCLKEDIDIILKSEELILL